MFVCISSTATILSVKKADRKVCVLTRHWVEGLYVHMQVHTIYTVYTVYRTHRPTTSASMYFTFIEKSTLMYSPNTLYGNMCICMCTVCIHHCYCWLSVYNVLFPLNARGHDS